MIRRQVAATMGQVGDPSFAPTLVRLLDDQHNVRLAALEALPKVVGSGNGVPAGDLGEQIEYWKRTVAARK